MTLPKKITEILITANDNQKTIAHEFKKMGYRGYWSSVLCPICDYVLLDVHHRETEEFVAETCTTVSCLLRPTLPNGGGRRSTMSAPQPDKFGPKEIPF